MKYRGPTMSKASLLLQIGSHGKPKTFTARPYFTVSVVTGSPVLASNKQIRSGVEARTLSSS